MNALRCFAVLIALCSTLAVASAILPSPLPVNAHPSRPAKGQQTPVYTEPARQHLDDVLKQPEFSRTVTMTKIRLKNKAEMPEEKKNDPQFLEWLLPYLLWLAQALAQVMEVVMWLCALGAVGIIIKYRQNWMTYLGKFSRAPQPAPSVFASNTPQPSGTASLPGNIPHAVSALWQSGDKTAALSLLYRASLRGLDTTYHLTLSKGTTEMEVLRAIPAHQPLLHSYLTRLIMQWQRMAYASHPSETPEATELIDELVEGYRRLFERTLL